MLKIIDQKYSKKEKLKHQKDIECLFEKGTRIFQYPFQWVILEDEKLDTWVRFGVSVRKKDFKKACDRNYLKRRMRECFRLHKKELYMAISSKNHMIMLVYCGKSKMNFSSLEAAYLKGIEKIKTTYSPNPSTSPSEEKLP